MVARRPYAGQLQVRPHVVSEIMFCRHVAAAELKSTEVRIQICLVSRISAVVPASQAATTCEGFQLVKLPRGFGGRGGSWTPFGLHTATRVQQHVSGTLLTIRTLLSRVLHPAPRVRPYPRPWSLTYTAGYGANNASSTQQMWWWSWR